MIHFQFITLWNRRIYIIYISNYDLYTPPNYWNRKNVSKKYFQEIAQKSSMRFLRKLHEHCKRFKESLPTFED